MDIYIGDSKFEAKNDKVVFHNLLFQYYKFFTVYNINNSNQKQAFLFHTFLKFKILMRKIMNLITFFRLQHLKIRNNMYY